jgi:hypothetical protein
MRPRTATILGLIQHMADAWPDRFNSWKLPRWN